MKRLFLTITLVAAAAYGADSPVPRVVDDAKAIDRVAEMAHGDLPTGILSRIISQDIDLLRGRKADDTYEYARYERMEASRTSDSFSIQPTGEDRLSRADVKGQFVYRVVLEMPSRRLIVTKNRPLFIDHVEIESLPQSGSTLKTQSVKVGETLAPGATKTIELDDIARQATAHVFARAAKDAGYANLTVTLVQARIFDNPDSPYADAVASAKAIQRAIDKGDSATIRAMAQRIADGLHAKGGVAPPAAVAALPAATPAVAGDGDVLPELQSIEDLLTGSDSERRAAADRLHQLIRRLRTR